MRLLVIADIHSNWPALQRIESEATVVRIKAMGLAEAVAEGLICILHTGKPCTTVAPEGRVEKIR